jgi:C1q domain
MKNLIVLILFLLSVCTPVLAGTEAILKADQIDGLESVKNYMKEKAHFEKNVNGWSAYADAAGTRPVDGTGGSPTITCTRSTTSPITGDGSLIVTKDAANRQGQGCAAQFTIGNEMKSKIAQIEIDYRVVSGTFAAGSNTTDSDLIVYIYDVTNSTLIEPTSIKFLTSSTTTPDKMITNFQTSATGTTYNLILHEATTSASAFVLMLDNFKVTASRYVYGTPITDWVAWTPTGSWSANTTYTGLKRRVGGDGEYKVKLAITGAVTAANLTINLPSGEVIDTNRVTDTTANANWNYGQVTMLDTGTATFVGGISYNNTTSFQIRALSASATYVQDVGAVTNTVPATWANGDIISIDYKAPIAGWSSNLQVSDGFNTAEISFVVNVTTTAASASTPFIYTTVVSNKGGGYNVANGKFTAPTQGTYFFRATSYTGSTLAEPVCYLNSTAYIRGPAQKDSSTPSIVTCMAVMNANDTMEIRPNGAATATGDLTLNSFSGFKISSPQNIVQTEAVSVLYTGTPTGTIANAFNTMTFPTKVWDSHNAYASGTFTVPKTTFYNICAQSTQSATYTAGGAAVTAIAIGGTQTYTAIATMPAATTTGSPLVCVQGIPLLQGQLITIQSLNNGSSPSYTTPLAGANYLSILGK